MKTSTLIVILFFWSALAGFAEPRSEAIGLWWVAHGDGAPLQVRLYADGRAWSDYPSNNPGTWSVRDGKVVCLWADDWKEVFVPDPSKQTWTKLGYKPGVSLEQAPTNVSRAMRVSEQADGWFGVKPLVKP